jgi:hypothetical protein
LPALLNDDEVLVTGELDSNSQALASEDMFGPNSGSFTRTGDMATPRAYHTATLLKDGVVFVTVEVSGAPLATAELYQ